MAEEGLLEALCEEVSCSICLDYFRDPVSIPECGHSFCRACLTRSWGESGVEPSCPQCRGRAQEGNLRPSHQLANLVEIAKRFCPSEGKGAVCKEHGEPLKFFCREDGAPLCVVCSRSREHRGHQVTPLEEGEEAAGEKKTVVTARRESVCRKHQELLKFFCEDHEALICVVCEQSQEHQYHKIVPVEEASQEYKDQFCTCVEILRKERTKILAYKDSLVKESQELLKQTKGEQQKAVTKFRQLRTFLDKQEKLLLAQMEEVEKEVAKKRDQHLAELSEELSSLESLIREMEEKCQQSAGDLLKDARSTLQRYEEKAAFENPEAFPLALKWRIWDFSDLNPLLEGIKKQLKGNEEMLHGPLLCHLAPAGDARASHVLPAASQRVGVNNTAPNLATRPLVATQAPRAVLPYRYASSVHSPHPAVQPLQASQPAVHMWGQGPLTASMLAAAPPQEQKQMLGERLFPLIQAMRPCLAGKITGMLLEVDNSELLHLLESPESLRSKVNKAVAVLQAHQAKEAAARNVGVVAATSSARKSGCKKAT